MLKPPGQGRALRQFLGSLRILACSLLAGAPGFEPGSAGPKPASLSKLAYAPKAFAAQGHEQRIEGGGREKGIVFLGFAG